jgi:hypothetical protein
MDGKLIKRDSYYHLESDGNIIAGNHIADNYEHKLSIKNCESIANGYDLDELSFNYADEIGILHTTLAYSKHFKEGFSKAMEIQKDKLFTAEDMKKAIAMARKGSQERLHDGYGNFTQPIFVLSNTPPEEIIQSLQQNEWDVEVVMCNSRTGKELTNLALDLEWDEDGLSDVAIPKLDEDGCLILKKI